MANYQLNLLGQQVQSALDQVATNTSAIGDLSDLETSDKDNLVAAINEAAQSESGKSAITYYTSRVVSVANAAEILRITNSSITADTVVLGCVFDDPSYISGDVTWTSYAGYISFIGTCTVATTADVTLGTKNN